GSAGGPRARPARIRDVRRPTRSTGAPLHRDRRGPARRVVVRERARGPIRRGALRLRRHFPHPHGWIHAELQRIGGGGHRAVTDLRGPPRVPAGGGRSSARGPSRPALALLAPGGDARPAREAVNRTGQTAFERGKEEPAWPP